MLRVDGLGVWADRPTVGQPLPALPPVQVQNEHGDVAAQSRGLQRRGRKPGLRFSGPMTFGVKIGHQSREEMENLRSNAKIKPLKWPVEI